MPIVCMLELQEMFVRMSCMCDDCVKWKEERKKEER